MGSGELRLRAQGSSTTLSKSRSETYYCVLDCLACPGLSNTRDIPVVMGMGFVSGSRW